MPVVSLFHIDLFKKNGLSICLKIQLENNNLCEEYQLDPLEVPWIQVPPRRYTGEAAEYQPKNSEEYSRKQYFQFIDVSATGLL